MLKYTIEQTDLVAAVKAIEKVIEKSSTLPILECVKATVIAGKLTLEATDLDLMIRVEVPSADSAESIDGEICIPFKAIKQLAKNLPKGQPVKISTDEMAVFFKYGESLFEVDALPTDDFPGWKDSEESYYVSITGDVINDGISRVKHAISTEETRYYLNGIFIEPNADGIKMVSTDGHQLAWRDCRQIETSGNPDAGFILPRKACLALEFITKKSTFEDVVYCSFSNTKAAFKHGNIELHSKLVDGTFPDYRRVIPGKFDSNLLCNAADLAAGVKRVGGMSNEKSVALKLTLNGSVKLSIDTGSGISSENMFMDYDGEELEIGFNSTYMLNQLKNFDEQVNIEMAKSHGPALMTDPNDDRGGYVIMPMRV